MPAAARDGKGGKGQECMLGLGCLTITVQALAPVCLDVLPLLPVSTS